MPLAKEDLLAIEQIVARNIDKSLDKALHPLKKDVSELKRDVSELKKDVSELKKDVAEMKVDLRLLATINQLDEIKKDKRLRGLYSFKADA